MILRIDDVIAVSGGPGGGGPPPGCRQCELIELKLNFNKT